MDRVYEYTFKLIEYLPCTEENFLKLYYGPLLWNYIDFSGPLPHVDKERIFNDL